MQNIKTKEVVTYVTMPRVVPRLKGLFASGFGYLSFLMAHVYKIVRLIPENHPYLLTENIGRYGIRHVVAEAANNLKFSFRNLDQIIIFVALLAGLAMMVLQVALLFYAVFITPSMAASWFDTANPEFDIAFNLLDQIFGIPDIYCSTSAPGNCTDYATIFFLPMPYHQALHGLFQFYSTGLLLIGVLILLYFIIVIIVETAVTGTPFGQRFQNFWVPVRLVVAIGLLMPIQYGINSGQYIILYAAKYGSGLATNGWIGYNDAVTSHSIFTGNGRPLGEPYSHLALPEAPSITPLLEAMSLVHACAYAYHRLNSGESSGKTNVTRGDGSTYQDIRANYASTGNPDPWEFEIQPFLVKTPTAGLPSGALGSSPIFGDNSQRIWIQNPGTAPYHSGGAGNALGFYYGSDIIVRFGEFRVVGANPSAPTHENQPGNVMPLCGDVRIPISDLTDPGGGNAGRGGADHMQQFYYETVLDLWFNEPQLRRIGRTLVVRNTVNDSSQIEAFCAAGAVEGGGQPLSAQGLAGAGIASPADCRTQDPDSRWRTEFIEARTLVLQAEILEAWENYVLNSTYADFDVTISSRGWGGAGIWYNKIAEINGGWLDGVRSVPYMDKYPMIMEQVKEFVQQNTENPSPLDLFDPSVRAEGENSAAKPVKVDLDPEDMQIAEALNGVFQYWNPKTAGKNGNELDEIPPENILINAINLLLGTTGLAEMRRANKYLHPLAQLVAIGKGLVNSAVFNMAASSVSAFLGGALRAMDRTSGLAGVGEAASKVFYATAFLGLTAGFVLFYVLPFLPFLYFYFAVASWVKAIFEAMLGAPLWALAHLRIDGEGLPGDAASNGYFLILEIFIRPILTVFGLLAAIIIFAAQVRILNLVWDVVIENAAGFTRATDITGEAVDANYIDLQRGILDQFFFTLVYAIVCYMLALASFKLIDKIPDNILRWAGAGVSSYGDIDQDQVESLSRYAATGGMTIGSQATQAVTGAAQGLGGAVGKEFSTFMNSGRMNRNPGDPGV